MMNYVERISMMKNYLTNHVNIPCEMRELNDGAQLVFPWCKGDVACHSNTYGCNRGDVETYQFPFDEDDVSVLSPIDALVKIVEYYDKYEALKREISESGYIFKEGDLIEMNP